MTIIEPKQTVFFCQSCAMPMETDDDYGKNRDGTRSEYCRYCFSHGKFIEPRITAEEMIKKVASYMVRLGAMTESQAREAAAGVIPGLKRWRRDT